MQISFSNAERAEVLTQALPYIKRYVGKTVVVKYGGNAMINPDLKQQVMDDIVLLWLIGVKVVLVHGGGPEISSMMDKLGKKPEFIDGLRVTDKETVDIVQMVLAGKVNKSLVTMLEKRGGNAIGLCGMDGKLIEAARDLGATGFQTLRDVMIPLTSAGIVSGITMVFVPSVSTFYISQKLGGGKYTLIGDVIEMQFQTAYNYNLGASISLLLMVFILFCLFVMNRFGDTEEGGVVA